MSDDFIDGIAGSLSRAWDAAKEAFSTGRAGSPIQQCPTTLESTDMPDGVPTDCCAAPSTINLPKSVNDTMQVAYKNSFPDGKSKEHGGTIIKNAHGVISVVNEGSGKSNSFSANRSVQEGQRIIGIFHTHSYDESEGGTKGVSFSGADIAIAINRREPDYVDAGDRQFAIVATRETPSSIDHTDMETEWYDDFGKRLKSGTGFAEASRQTTLAIAKKYKMAYYEGSNGILKKVSC